MGRSAKVHKRVSKKSKSSSLASRPQESVKTAQKQSNLKSKANAPKPSEVDPRKGLLGGADYVSLMMGGRKKARAEAAKLPQDSPP